MSGRVGFLFLSGWGPGYLTMLLGYAKSRITVHNDDIYSRNLLQFYHLKSCFPLLNTLGKKWIGGTSLAVQQVRLKGRGFNPWIEGTKISYASWSKIKNKNNSMPVTIVTQLCKYTKNHCIVQVRQVNCTVWKSQLNNKNMLMNLSPWKCKWLFPLSPSPSLTQPSFNISL